MTYPEDDHQRSVRPFLFDLLRWKHLASFEIMDNLAADQDRHIQCRFFGKPDIGATFQNGIQVLRDGLESRFGNADSFYPLIPPCNVVLKLYDGGQLIYVWRDQKVYISRPDPTFVRKLIL